MFGPDGARVLVVLVGVNKRGFDAKFRQPLAQKLCHAAINVALCDNVVAALQQSQNAKS